MMINHQERYDKWASTYNVDVKNRNYYAPSYIVEYLMEVVNQQVIDYSNKSELKVLDAGCGTGLLGVKLRQEGFSYIDGVDFSHEMVKLAYETGAYQYLMGWCDLNKKPPFFFHHQYDLTICCGVFSFDLVKPTALRWLMEVTKPGGIILMSTRLVFCETYNFEGYYKELEQLGELKLIDCRMNKPYLGEESNAHYWVFAIPESKK
ncbi:class I SAM-dependent methyltransferase [Okeania sp. SIO1F9]|uniref:class I SAM-dependent DNA methyltransferase n=2 Tax=unclassified Okeania TaxID=2634635 RepID=UPI002579E1C5|nr:class I SAM-dependent methyltransferase [Okeania sp. SIO1F9]